MTIAYITLAIIAFIGAVAWIAYSMTSKPKKDELEDENNWGKV